MPTDRAALRALAQELIDKKIRKPTEFLDAAAACAHAVLAALETPKAERAHTYASENADHYRGFEEGWDSCRESVLDRMEAAMKGENARDNTTTA